MYRCAQTVPAPPFAERGACNPDYESTMKLIGARAALPFSLETESAKSLQDRMTAGTLSAETLTKAYLARIAMTNAEGPALQAVRALNTHAIEEARCSTASGRRAASRGPLHGMPVLLDDVIDAKGLPTTGGSIALQKSLPNADAALVAKLKAAGAIILGKTNVSELNGLLDANAPEGYSSLGGQVLLPSDTDKTPAGSSAGCAAATAAGLAALTVGLETSTDTAQIIAPAGVAGVVALKPTVGLVSHGRRPAGRQVPGRRRPDHPHRADAATGLGASPARPTRSRRRLTGKRVAVIDSTRRRPVRAHRVQGLGATTVTRRPPRRADPASIVTRSFEKDLNAYLGGTSGGAGSLQGIVNYNTANPVEGLKYQQGQLLGALRPDLAALAADTAAGKTPERR